MSANNHVLFDLLSSLGILRSATFQQTSTSSRIQIPVRITQHRGPNFRRSRRLINSNITNCTCISATANGNTTLPHLIPNSNENGTTHASPTLPHPPPCNNGNDIITLRLNNARKNKNDLNPFQNIPVKVTNRPSFVRHSSTQHQNNNNKANLRKVKLSEQRTKSQFPCFLLLNARSLLPKIDELSALLATIDVDLVAVTETWLKEDVPKDLVSIDGFSVQRRDRPHRGGGGVYLTTSPLKDAKI